jgi:predicted metalloprotease
VTLAEGWAALVQRKLGRPTAGDRGANAVKAGLENDCFVGSFVSDVANRRIDAGTTLSPGDLDEAVASLTLGASAERGRAFARIEALRRGFRTGAESCVK